MTQWLKLFSHFVNPTIIMQKPNQCPSTTLTKQTFTKLLKSSSSTHQNQLKQIHAQILTTGLSIKNSLLTQLLSNLTVLGNMHYARKLFDEMHKPRTFLWNTIIKGYVKHSLYDEAALLYMRMRKLGVAQDSYTFPFVIKAVSGISRDGLGVHGLVVKHGVECVNEVRTELVVMYVKFGELGLAQFLFQSMSAKDLVGWNAFISACVQSGYASKGLELFRSMVGSGIRYDGVTIVSALSGCAQLGCLDIGERIYGDALNDGVDCNVIVDNARLDMYMKCGSVDMAGVVFAEMSCRNVISWSIMIMGYSVNGESEKALELFCRMQDEGLQPNYVTYLGVLMACSHAGLVNRGRAVFDQMVNSGNGSIQPRKEHYACMVDLLGRSGHLDEAYRFIQTIPFEPDPGIWGALLGACVIHSNIHLGQLVADSLFELAPDIASYNVLLSNMFASAGRWDCVDKVRLRMKKNSTKKVAAYSSVEFHGKIHVFYRKDRLHPESAAIYEKLNDILKQIKGIGYIPSTGSVFHDVELEEKEDTVSTHSEKLAIAFGLINISPELPVRVIKNLRICDDCHTFSKYVSKLFGREIIMRDKSRYHRFRNGSCSCNNFW